MFDVGWSELLLIGIVALIVIGPKDLPKVLRAVGTMMSKVRSMANEFQGQFQEAMREAEIADLKKEAEKLASTATSTIQNPMQSIQNEIQSSIDAPAAPTQLQPTPPAASDAQIDQQIPAPPQPAPVNIEPAPIAPNAATSAESANANEPVRKQGTGT